MSVTIEVVCYKSKVLANNESPLMLRITKDRKLKYSSIGISINPVYWDFEKNKPRRNCPNRVNIERVIADKITSYRSKMIELQAENKDFTATSLHERLINPVSKKTVGELFLSQIKSLNGQKRTGYALSHLEAYNSLVKFNGHLNIYFSDIDTTWLKRYENWLRSGGSAENTIGKRIRTLRAVFNLAIEQKTVKAEYYPFKAYKVSKLSQATAKRSISKEHINQIVGYQSNHRYTALAIDLFTFSYLTGGINFVDMAYMKGGNLMDGRLIYTRKKTGKLIRLPLQPRALEIIEKYLSPFANDEDYIFPILSAFHKTEIQKRNRIHKVITKINKCLKEVGKELKIPIDLTTYVARHSYATVLKRAGVSTSIICESLGHSSEKVTQYYLDSFENSQIDEAMKNLL